MDLSETFTKPLKDFAKNSLRLVKRCTKPDAKGTLGTNASRWGGGAPVKCWWSGGVGGEREREASAGPSGHPHTRGRSHPLARKGSMIARALCGGRARSRGSSPPPHTHTHPNTTPHRLPPPFAHVSVSCAVFSDPILRPPPSHPPPLPPLLDCAEYKKICLQTIIGFTIMGFIGFFVKLIFIPINNIIMGGNAEAATEAAAA